MGKSSKKQTVKFVLDCTAPVEDKVLDVASFEKYLHDRIKVDGKTGALASKQPIDKMGKSSKKQTVKFVLDCTAPVEDKVLDVASFEKYLHDRIKVDGKTGALASNNVVISREKNKLTVASPADLGFSKRQLKYLAKRYLKKQQLRDYLRVVASNKNTYELRYFSISGGDDEEAEE